MAQPWAAGSEPVLGRAAGSEPIIFTGVDSAYFLAATASRLPSQSKRPGLATAERGTMPILT